MHFFLGALIANACPAKRGLSYFENSVDSDELAGKIFINSFLVRGDFCCLLITFENSLDSDKD